MSRIKEMEYRIAHCRFNGSHPVGKADFYNRVVTLAWDFDNGILRYGATVFKQTDGDTHWARQKHKNRAVQRFCKNPVKLVLDVSQTTPDRLGCFFKNTSMDWFIATELVFKYGTSWEQPPEKYPMVVIPNYFDEIYRLNAPYNYRDTDELCDYPACCYVLGFLTGVFTTTTCYHFLL